MYVVCGYCVLYTAFCLYVCIFFLCATILVNKDVYNRKSNLLRNNAICRLCMLNNAN